MKELLIPFSLRSLSKGYQAYVGPLDRIPATMDINHPLPPAFLPKDLAIFLGLKNMAKKNIKRKTKNKTGIIFSNNSKKTKNVFMAKLKLNKNRVMYKKTAIIKKVHFP